MTAAGWLATVALGAAGFMIVMLLLALGLLLARRPLRGSCGGVGGGCACGGRRGACRASGEAP